MPYDVEKPDEQWREELTPAEYAVLRQARHRTRLPR